MATNPSFEELQGLDTAVPSFEELQGELPSELKAISPEQLKGKTLAQHALTFLQNIPAAQAAGLMPIAAKGPAGIIEAPFQFLGQFAKEPAEAPTMEEVMQVAGVPPTEIPIPEVEPGLGVSIPASQLEALAKVPKEQQLPETVPASEVAAQTALMATDPLLVAGGLRKAVLPTAKLGYEAAKLGTKAAAGATGGAVGAVLPAIEEGKFGRITELAKKGYGTVGKGFESIESLPAKFKEEWQNLKPTIRPKFLEQYELANRVGINPDLIAENARLIYGPDAFVTKAKAAKSAVSSELESQKFDQLQVEISNALAAQAQQVSSGKVITPDKVAAGEAIRKSWNDKVNDIFNEAQVRYSNLADEIPSKTLDKDAAEQLWNALEISKAEEEKALKFASTSAAKKPHRANLEAIQSIKNNIFEDWPTGKVFTGNLQQAIDQLQQIGREAYSSPTFFGLGEVPASKSLLKDLYTDLKTVVLATTEKERPDLLPELLQSNKVQSDFFKQNAHVGELIQNPNIPPEQVYTRLVKSGNSNQLAALKNLIGDKDANDIIKGQLLFDLLEKKGVGGETLFNTISKEMRKEDFKRIQNTFFAPGETDLFNRIIELGQNVGAKEFNPSQSGKLIKVLDYVQSPVKSIEAAVTGKTTTELLESEAYQKYFKDYPLSSVIDRRVRGGFNQDLLDEVIIEKMKDPVVKKQFETSLQVGKTPQPIIDAYNEVGKKQNPINRYSALKAVAEYTSKLIDPITPNNTMLVYRALQAANRVNRMKYGPEKHVPIFIPEQDREDAINVIKDSQMNSIQKAKNIRNISNYGYLLDLTGFNGEEKESIQSRIMQKGLVQPPKEENKPQESDILNKLEQKESR